MFSVGPKYLARVPCGSNHQIREHRADLSL